MEDCAELELGLYRSGENRYSLHFRFWQPGSSAVTTLGPADPLEVTFPQEALLAAQADPAEYGRCLAGSLFADPRALRAFAEARAFATARNVPLRLRLYIDAGAAELQRLRWETCIDPDRQVPLFTDENLLFARFVPSASLQTFAPPERARLRAVVVIANPSNLYPGLEPIGVSAELARARAGLIDMDLVIFDSGGKATLEALLDALRSGVDVLYLVAHGGISRQGETALLLEKADGTLDRVSADNFVTRIGELSALPLLAVLVSCQSAGTGEGEQGNALVSLGPRLASAGIPAVIAMHGKVSFQTMDAFLPIFFRELRRDGQIDRALAASRGQVRQRPDWWMPVLFSRLRDNRLLTPSAAAQPIALQHFEPETVYVPGGPFLMGRDSGGSAWEAPRHTVELPAYRIGKYPVTNRQFGEYIRQTGQPVNPETGWFGQTPPPDRLDYPVSGVTWFQAVAYCAWLSEKTGRKYSLPTEAQWEKAVRGDKGSLYPWGDAWEDDRCNTDPAVITPIQKYLPQGPYGCSDMIGNVREWTLTLWGERRSEPDFSYPFVDDGRNNPDANALVRRVYRGGTGDTPQEMTCTARNGYAPDKSGPPGKRHGFRVVLTV
jgi:formylglycine-generating enzyme required for sulfatase activity